MLSDSSFDSFSFVVRPHPAENDSLYKMFFKDNNRVIISNSFTAVEWSKKAYCTIHDGCTTGVEAYLAGCKVINYREQFKENMAINIIPNSVGLNASGYEDLKRKIFGDHDLELVKDYSLCSKMILNFDLEIDSFEKVVDEVVDSLKLKSTARVSKRIFLFDAYESVKSFFKLFLRRFFVTKQSNYIKDRKKFDGFDKKDVIKKISLINDEGGSDIKLSRFNKSYIVIE